MTCSHNNKTEHDHLSPSSVKFKNEWSYTSASPVCLRVRDRDKFTFIMHAHSSGQLFYGLKRLRSLQIFLRGFQITVLWTCVEKRADD